jgi:transcriptional regulator with XRE-family HTH domain
MDDARIGRICRALRRRRGWTQAELASKAGCHQTTISRIERGQVADLRLAVARLAFGVFDASFDGIVGWRSGDLDRLLDDRNAGTIETVAVILGSSGWLIIPEASYSEWGERGSIDILAGRADARAVAVVEIKTEIASVEETIRKHDQKSRLAFDGVARKRLGWSPDIVGRFLVAPEDATIRRVIGRHEATFSAAYPLRSRAIRRWLEAPNNHAAGVWFLSPKRGGAGSRTRGGPRRVRHPVARESSA